MSEIKVNDNVLELDENLIQVLNKFIRDDDLCSMSPVAKMNALFNFVDTNYKKAMKKTQEMFSQLEAYYIACTFNTHIIDYNTELSMSEYILREVQDFYDKGSVSFCSKEDIKIEILLNKIKDLDDFQAVVLINDIKEFWTVADMKIEDLSIVY